MLSKREQSVLDGRTKLLVILLLCMTVLVESVIKERAKCTRWQDKIIGYITLVHNCIGGKCHQNLGKEDKICVNILVEIVTEDRALCTRG